MNRNPETWSNNSRIRRIDPDQPDASLIKEAARIIKAGGLVVFPTRDLYGIAADALNTGAVQRVFSVKQRPAEKPLPVLIKSRPALSLLTEEIPEAALLLMNRFWPGRVTIVLFALPKIPPVLTGGTGKIGVRMPTHPVAAALVNAAGCPLTATSANLSGRAGSYRVEDIPSGIIDKTDLILDAGPLQGGVGSTVVDATESPPVIIREGAVSRRDILGVQTHNREKPL